ncbi:pseudouridine synthase [Aureibaculum conchae]|uniref:pseudouridine synthase n=1 Tax=Aureibaculum sp. 2308TA14-22 TaxID=3108392 RepID=UPI003391879F
MAKQNSSRGRHAKASSSDSKKKSTTVKKSFDKSKKFGGKSKPNPYRKDIRKDTPKQRLEEPTEIRLNKYISNSGICSRREADVFIKAGSATVNGKVITEMGYKVKPTDDVRFDGALINPEAKRYVLLNKPKNYITTMDDERGRKTVMELVGRATKERIYPVGRLDRNTTGLLLFTNDGEMAKKLTHPKHNVKKLYHASLDKKLALSDLQKISENFVLEGKMVFVDAISYIDNQPKTEVGIEIHSGRNRIVRKIFEHFDYKVIKLDRVIFAGMTKKNLPRGHWRHLTQQEVNNLKII